MSRLEGRQSSAGWWVVLLVIVLIVIAFVLAEWFAVIDLIPGFPTM